MNQRFYEIRVLGAHDSRRSVLALEKPEEKSILVLFGQASKC